MRILFIKMPLLMPISAVMVTDGVLDTTLTPRTTCLFSKRCCRRWLDLTERCARQLLADVVSPPLGA